MKLILKIALIWAAIFLTGGVCRVRLRGY